MTEVSYTDNQLGNEEENDNEFIEENLIDNFNQYNYQQITPTKQGLLRGKGNKGLGKSLRKTVLRSIDGKEQEKEFENGKLRNVKSNKKNENIQSIISFTENNDFLQCANCHKFFCSDENEQSQTENKTTENITQNNQNIHSNAQQFSQKPQQNMPYPQQFQPLPQHSPHQPKQNPKQQHHERPPQIPQNPYPKQKQNIPHNQQKISQKMNMNMGFPPKPNPQGFFQQNKPYTGGGQPKSQNQQQFYQQKNNAGGFPGFNQQMPRHIGNNQVFRARKREVNEYEEEYDNNIDHNDYIAGEIYYHPSSSKKFRSEKKVSEEFPIHKHISHNIGNQGLSRNLSFGAKNNIIQRREISCTDNNLREYINVNDNENYEYPNYKRNLIPTGRTKYNNHRMVNVKVARDTPYQYQEYEDYYDYDYDYGN